MALSIKPYIENKERIHLIGIGGVSMNSLGRASAEQGCAGLRLRPPAHPTSPRVSRRSARSITYEHRPENVEGASLIVRTAAVHDDNPEIVARARAGHPGHGTRRGLGPA